MKKKLVISTGAGMSAESGINTFRDAGGLWENYNVMEVASADGFRRNPALIHKFYNARRKELLKARPNAGHLGLVDLEKDFDVFVITQNVDNLHEKGHPVRPHIVFFQEAVPNIEPAVELVREADIFVVIGTSLNVYPAAGLLHYVRPGVPVYYIDPNPAAVPPGVTVIPLTATEGVARLASILRSTPA